MRTFYIVLVFLLAIFLFSIPASFGKKTFGPNPRGLPDTPKAPPPMKKAPPKSATPNSNAGAGTKAKTWLNLHNMYRKKENMPELEWSDTLYNALQSHVDRWVSKSQCSGAHPFEGMTLQRYGQNAAYVNSSIKNTESAIVYAWYAQKQNYNPKTKNCTNDGYDSCGSFTQLMWRASQYVACRADKCQKSSDRIIGMCWYARPGNCQGRDYKKPARQSPCGPYTPPKN